VPWDYSIKWDEDFRATTTFPLMAIYAAESELSNNFLENSIVSQVVGVASGSVDRRASNFLRAGIISGTRGAPVNAGKAEIRAYASDSTSDPDRVMVQVDGANGNNPYTILDDNDASHFVFSPAGGHRRFNLGTVAGHVFTAGSQFFDVVITHNLGVTPGAAFLNFNWTNDLLAPQWAEIKSWSSTTVTFRVAFGGNLGGNVTKNLHWMAAAA
jgi:hypothetical protein